MIILDSKEIKTNPQQREYLLTKKGFTTKQNPNNWFDQAGMINLETYETGTLSQYYA